MFYRFNFLKIFQEKHFRWSIHAIIFLSLFILFATGCNDSNSKNNSASVGDTETETPLTDAEWLAFQDGDGSWQEIEIPEDGIFVPTVTDSEGRYGLTFLTADATDQSVSLQVLLTTTAELPQIDVSVLLESDSGDFQVTVEEPQNLENSTVNIFVGDDETAVSTGFTYSRTFSKEPGIYDLFVTQTASGDTYPTNYITRRDIELTSGASVEETISTADYDSSTAFTGPYTISVQGSGEEIDSSVYSGGVNLITTNLTEVELGDKENTDSSLQYSALGSSLTGDDIYLLCLDIELEDTDDTYYDAYYYEGFIDEGDKTISPLLETFDVTFDFDTDTGSTIPGISDISDIETGVVVGYMMTYRGSVEDGIEYSSMIYISGERVQDATSFSMPDFSSSDGWSDNWSIPDDITTEYAQASVYIGSGSSVIETIANWFSNAVVRFEDGEWLSVLRKAIFYDTGEVY